MEESITFWLDNKISSGFKIAEIGTQTLVLYRDKYYIVVGGAAQMKGVRPLHYSKTSLPTLWKKALKGILPTPTAVVDSGDDEFLPITTSTKKERKPMQKDSDTAEFSENQQPVAKPTQTAPKKSAATDIKPVKISQAAVTTTCPSCNHKQDIPFEKGKNGRPFFTACVRCSTEFAVRFVPVTMYQAQVAAFK